MPTNRTTFIIDGFNLYHSVATASYDLGNVTTKWLDVKALCKSHLQLWGKDHIINDVYYFSALAYHCEANNRGIVDRHKKFIACLESTGVIIELANFKGKDIYCHNCKKHSKHHEEKETDVAIASKIFELLHNDLCDTIVIMSGDTDIAPAVRTCKRIFPQKDIHFLFPYKRMNNELKTLCPKSMKISRENYANYQFPNPVVLQNGKEIFRPTTW